MVQYTAAMVLSVAVLCSVALLCQANPMYWRESEFAREEEKEILEDIAARIISELESAMMIQQNGGKTCNESVKSHFAHRATANELNPAADGSVTFSCQSNYSLFVSFAENAVRAGERTFEEVQTTSLKYECPYSMSIKKTGYPRCFRLCPDLDIGNGTVNYEYMNGHLPGDTATYSCVDNDNDVFKLSGEATATCSDTAEWFPEEAPTCIPLRCPLLNPIPNGDMDADKSPVGGGYPVNTVVTYTCDIGYLLRGEDTRICLRSEKWHHPEPSCEPHVHLCRELPAPLNGAVDYGNREPGDVANYTCRDGYRLVGQETRICERHQDGITEWSGNHPVCEIIIICPLDNLPITNGEFSPSSGPITGPGGSLGYAVGTVVNYTCVSDHFELRGESSIICLESGEWSHPPPSCYLRLCPVLQAPSNGAVNYGNREPGDVATYTCRHGYRLVGPETRMCVHDQDGIPKWSGKPSVCEILCPLVNPIIPNGDVDADKSLIPGPGGGFPVDTVVTYTCDNGYLLQGEDTRICLRSGKWDHPEPNCSKLSPPVIICSPDSLPITNGEFSPSKGLIRGTGGRLGYGVGTVVNYRCTLDRFKLRGESSITCLQSGEWSHPPPRCVAAKCPELILSGNPRSVDETRRQIERDRPRDYKLLLIKSFFEKKIKGNPVPYDEGSKAYLTCINGWKRMSGSPSFQTCVRNSTSGDLYWTDPGTCVYKYYTIRPAFTGGTG